MRVLTITDPFNPRCSTNLAIKNVNIDINLTIYEFNEEENEFKDKLLEVDKVAENIFKQIKSESIELIAIPSTPYLKMISSRLAILFDTGIVADVQEVVVKDNIVSMVRPTYEETKLATIESKKMPYIYTYRDIETNFVDNQINFSTKRRQIINLEYETKLTAYYSSIDDSYDIGNYDIVFCAGLGFGDNFSKLEELSKHIKIGLAATKKSVDAGYVDHKYQIGLSSKKIAPKLYIGLGVYGAIQHIVGMENSNCIVSVNTSSNAALNSIAHIVIKGDANSLVDKLLEYYK